MDFAKNMMKKYGWKEGDGLGKNKAGISKPLSAHLKFDTAGFGVDQAAEFNNHWWQRVYNQAANNIIIKEGTDQISLGCDETNPVEISTKSYSVKKLKTNKKTGYDYFLKSSTLNMGSEIEEQNRIKAEDLEMPKFNTLTDEELFAACGGRTAHKGARHGLKLTGKLERIKEQEQKLLEKLTSKREDSTQMETEADEWTIVTNKKKKEKNIEKTSKMVENENLDSLNKIIYNTDYIHKSKKKKKRQKDVDSKLANELNGFEISKKLKLSNENFETLKLSKNSKAIKKTGKKKKNKLKLKLGENENMDLDDATDLFETERNTLDSEKRKNKNELLNDIKIPKKIELEEKQENSINYEDRMEIKKNKKQKKGKINKMKCKDKIIAKKIKKTIRVLDNLDSFLKKDKNESDN